MGTTTRRQLPCTRRKAYAQSIAEFDAIDRFVSYHSAAAALDSLGNVLVTGTGSNDTAFVLKLDSTGRQVVADWASGFLSWGYSIIPVEGSNIVLGGAFAGPFTLGPATFPKGQRGGYVMRFGP